MNGRKKKEAEMEMDTALNPEFTMKSDTSTFKENEVNAYTPGDSVNEHSQVEEGNEFIAGKEIGQQIENG
ncbi:hypothetical protein [Rossellomorea aquimaris]|uniref:hypothetical protein n=1 Tax=Rossellomorea aquimaris TaxID=189382 RepID=UPI0007D067D8|nr:hypothetical protein [Rossellomorea aquimaris]